jgi:hypothetical protein
MKSVWHIYTIRPQISHIISAYWLWILQMAYILRGGRGVEDEEQPPPPPPPTPVELMQTVVEGQRLLADAMHQLVNRDARHGRQGPEPNQHIDFKDFLDTKPPLFKEAEEPLQVDEWLNTIEQKFRLLRLTKELKTEYASHQLHGPTGIWWSPYRSTLPPNVSIAWDQFKMAFRGNYIPLGLMAIKHTGQGMQRSLWILMLRRLLASSVASVQS